MKKSLLIILLVIIASCSFIFFVMMKQEAKKEIINPKKVKFLVYGQVIIGIILLLLTIYCMKTY